MRKSKGAAKPKGTVKARSGAIQPLRRDPGCLARCTSSPPVGQQRLPGGARAYTLGPERW